MLQRKLLKGDLEVGGFCNKENYFLSVIYGR